MQLINLTSPGGPLQVQLCSSSLSRARGLMFRRTLELDRGIVLVCDPPGTWRAAIHTLFLNFDLAVIWVDDAARVTGKVLAMRWRPFYMPSHPARFVLELNAARYPDYNCGDQVRFVND